MKSPLPVNAADVWVNCPGSVMMGLTHPAPPIDEERSEKRREGRAFHQLSELMIQSGTTDIPELVGTLSDEGTVYNSEMYESAQLYVDDVFTLAEDRYTEFRVERHIKLDHIFPGVYGFIDASYYIPHKKEIVIYEAKYGHKGVDVFENWQMLIYASGLAEALGLDGADELVTNVRFRLVQPRSYDSGGPIREWVVMLSDLRAFINIARNSANEAYGPNPRCIPGPHCTNCESTHACKALQQSTYSAFDHIDDAGGLELIGTDLSLEYKKLLHYQDLIKSRISGLGAQLTEELRQGSTQHMYQNKPKYGRRTWNKKREEVIALGELMGTDLLSDKPAETPLLTPAQAEKKGIDASVISEYCSKPKRGFELVEINSANMRHIFTQK